MDEKHLADIKEKIIAEIEKTGKSIPGCKEMTMPISPEIAIGRISRMDAINNKSVTEAALRQAKEKLKKLKYVLNQVGQKDFGICAKCKHVQSHLAALC